MLESRRLREVKLPAPGCGQLHPGGDLRRRRPFPLLSHRWKEKPGNRIDRPITTRKVNTKPGEGGEEPECLQLVNLLLPSLGELFILVARQSINNAGGRRGPDSS